MTDSAETLRRALVRERDVSSAADIERRWRERYSPSQRYYFATSRPRDHADVIVYNDDPQQPAWQIRERR